MRATHPFASAKVYRIASRERRARRLVGVLAVCLFGLAAALHEFAGDITWGLFALLIASFLSLIGASIVPPDAKDPDGWVANLFAAAFVFCCAQLALHIYGGLGDGLARYAFAALGALAFSFGCALRLVIHFTVDELH